MGFVLVAVDIAYPTRTRGYSHGLGLGDGEPAGMACLAVSGIFPSSMVDHTHTNTAFDSAGNSFLAGGHADGLQSFGARKICRCDTVNL